MAGSALRVFSYGCLLASLVIVGCNRPATDGPKMSQMDGGVESPVAPQTPPGQPVPPDSDTTGEVTPSPPIGEQPKIDTADAADSPLPGVVMAASDRNACKVFVGDPFPSFDLNDVAGQSHSLQGSLGGKGTVIVFFQLGDDAMSRLRAENLLLDIQSDVASQYSAEEIAVLGICVGEASPQLDEVLKSAAVTFPVLVDANDTVLTQLTTKKPPCLYVLDGAGKVAWMDIEYGPAVRKQLSQAVKTLAER
ncbi:TlpA family protein disulfide reductase [Thermopirellula anaerolimosa]